MRLFRYGMKRKKFGYGNQPESGFFTIDRNDGVFGITKYYDIIVYTRELSADECNIYHLEELGEVEQ